MELESCSKKCKIEYDQMDVDSGQEASRDKDMLCQIEKILNSAELEDLEQLHEVVKSLGHARTNGVVTENYSPPRVTALARSLGLSPGFALDKTVVDPEDGQPLGFDAAAKREKSERNIREEKLVLLIGRPMCRAFSRLKELNCSKMDPLEAKHMVGYGVPHVCFCVNLHLIQIESGRCFLHEHLHGATSWDSECMKTLLAHPEVWRVRGVMCPHGMKSEDAEGIGRVLKPTGWARSPEYIAEAVSERCSNMQWRRTLAQACTPGWWKSGGLPSVPSQTMHCNTQGFQSPVAERWRTLSE